MPLVVARDRDDVGRGADRAPPHAVVGRAVRRGPDARVAGRALGVEARADRRRAEKAEHARRRAHARERRAVVDADVVGVEAREPARLGLARAGSCWRRAAGPGAACWPPPLAVGARGRVVDVGVGDARLAASARSCGDERRRRPAGERLDVQRHAQPRRAGGPLRRAAAGRPRPIPAPTTRRSRSGRRSTAISRICARTTADVRRGVRPRAPGTSSTRSTTGGSLPFCCQCCQAPSTAAGAVPGVVEDRHLPRSAAARAAGARGPRASGTRDERSGHRCRSEEPQSSPQSARDSNRAVGRMEAATGRARAYRSGDEIGPPTRHGSFYTFAHAEGRHRRRVPARPRGNGRGRELRGGRGSACERSGHEPRRSCAASTSSATARSAIALPTIRSSTPAVPAPPTTTRSSAARRPTPTRRTPRSAPPRRPASAAARRPPTGCRRSPPAGSRSCPLLRRCTTAAARSTT